MASNVTPTDSTYPSHQEIQHLNETGGDIGEDIKRVTNTFCYVNALQNEILQNGGNIPDTPLKEPITELTEMGMNYDQTVDRVEKYVNSCIQAFGKSPFSGGGGAMGGMGRHGKMGRHRGMDPRMMGHGGMYDEMDMGGLGGYDQGPWQCFYCNQSQPFQHPCVQGQQHALVPSSVLYEHRQYSGEMTRLRGEEEKLKGQTRDLEGRLKAEMGVKDGDKDVRINLKMDVSSISARYSEICVKEREDARKEIAKTVRDDVTILKDLCHVIEMSGSVTAGVVGDFRKSIEEMILNPSMDKKYSEAELLATKKAKWTPEHERSLNELLRSVSSQVNIDSLKMKVLELTHLTYGGPAFDIFVKETVLIAWIMAMQTPPMEFLSEDAVRHPHSKIPRDSFEEYEGRGGTVDVTKGKFLFVCPALREGPSIMSRGKVKALK